MNLKKLSKLCQCALNLAEIEADNGPLDKDTNTAYAQYLEMLESLDHLLIGVFFLDNNSLVYIVGRFEYGGAFYYKAVCDGVTLTKYSIESLENLQVASANVCQQQAELVQKCKDFARAIELAVHILESMAKV